MTLSSEKMMKLMAYADGELEGAERGEVEALLASEPDAARFVESIAGLGDFVKAGHEERDAKAIASFDVANAVMAKVKSEAKVVSLEAARRKRAAQTRIVGGILAAAAVAASVFFLTRPSETPMGQALSDSVAQASQAGPHEGVGPQARPHEGVGPQARPHEDVGPQAGPHEDGGPQFAALEGAEVQVTAAESAGNSVSVLFLPSANEISTSVVIWVDETGEK